ncbi:MAG: zinc finger protein [Pseudonocardiaceae bacterium]
MQSQSESHPFTWFPLAGLRHAINRQDRRVPLGQPMHCLCGKTHPRGPDGDTEWLWPTCPDCWEQACTLVGTSPTPDRKGR